MKKTLRIEYVKAPVKVLPGEDWAKLAINSVSEYYVSTAGRIYSVVSARILKGKLTTGNRMLDYTHTIDKNPLKKAWQRGKGAKSNRVSTTYQRLVAHTFIPKPEDCDVVIHLDHDKLNNNVANLKWATPTQAMNHSRQSPKFQEKGSGMSKLDQELVQEIKQLLSENPRPHVKEIAALYNISTMQVYRIQNGDNWKQVEGFTKEKKPYNVDPKTVTKLKKMLEEGIKSTEIARQLEISEATVSRIKNGHKF